MILVVVIVAVVILVVVIVAVLAAVLEDLSLLSLLSVLSLWLFLSSSGVINGLLQTPTALEGQQTDIINTITIPITHIIAV